MGAIFKATKAGKRVEYNVLSSQEFKKIIGLLGTKKIKDNCCRFYYSVEDASDDFIPLGPINNQDKEAKVYYTSFMLIDTERKRYYADDIEEDRKRGWYRFQNFPPYVGDICDAYKVGKYSVVTDVRLVSTMLDEYYEVETLNLNLYSKMEHKAIWTIEDEMITKLDEAISDGSLSGKDFARITASLLKCVDKTDPLYPLLCDFEVFHSNPSFSEYRKGYKQLINEFINFCKDQGMNEYTDEDFKYLKKADWLVSLANKENGFLGAEILQDIGKVGKYEGTADWRIAVLANVLRSEMCIPDFEEALSEYVLFYGNSISNPFVYENGYRKYLDGTNKDAHRYDLTKLISYVKVYGLQGETDRGADIDAYYDYLVDKGRRELFYLDEFCENFDENINIPGMFANFIIETGKCLGSVLVEKWLRAINKLDSYLKERGILPR